MAKQHNFTPIERARNAGWGMAYHMVLSDQMDLDDTKFKADIVETRTESDAYDEAKRAQLIRSN